MTHIAERCDDHAKPDNARDIADNRTSENFNGADLSRDLYTFIGIYLGHTLFPTMAVSAGMEGNGFELWRVLYRDYEGEMLSHA